jgi:hypothetical protein
MPPWLLFLWPLLDDSSPWFLLNIFFINDFASLTPPPWFLLKCSHWFCISSYINTTNSSILPTSHFAHHSTTSYRQQFPIYVGPSSLWIVECVQPLHIVVSQNLMCFRKFVEL